MSVPQGFPGFSLPAHPTAASGFPSAWNPESGQHRARWDISKNKELLAMSPKSPLKVEKSRALFAEAVTLLPGGVDSPVRAFKAVGGEPLFIERGEGPWLFDVGRQPLHRLCPFLGTAGARACASARPRRDRRGRVPRNELRRAEPAGAGPCPPGPRAHAERRADPVRQFRDRGGDERAAPCPRVSPAGTRS